MKKCLLSMLLAACAVSVVQGQTIIFTDTFSSGTAADAGYYRFGTTGTTLARDSTNNELDFTMGSTASSRSGVIKSFTEQTLAVDESIIFSFSINSRSLASAQNHAFRWAIGNLGNGSAVTGVPVTGDFTSATPFGSGAREMYQFSASTSSTAGFGQFVTGSSSPVHNQSGTGTAIASFAGPASVALTGATTVSLTITRTAASNYSFSQTAFGSTTSGTLTGVGTNIFNNLAFSFNNAPGTGTYDVALDNIQVTVVPEPSTWALLAGGMLATVVFRRRRRMA